MRSTVTDQVALYVVCRSVCHASEPCKNGWTDEMPFRLWTRTGPKNHELHGGPEPLAWEGAILGKGSPIVKYRDFLPWVVQKRLNRLIYCLGCGLGWAEGSTSSIVFARWRQCPHMGRYIGATWRIRLNRPSAAAMRSCVKLLWPLVKYPTTS